MIRALIDWALAPMREERKRRRQRELALSSARMMALQKAMNPLLTLVPKQAQHVIDEELQLVRRESPRTPMPRTSPFIRRESFVAPMPEVKLVQRPPTDSPFHLGPGAPAKPLTRANGDPIPLVWRGEVQ